MTAPYVKTFKSTDTGAPTLNGAIGSLNSVLDAILINGYNTQGVASITRVGNVATVSFSAAHGFPAKGAAIRLLGATQPEYNGDHVIFNVTSTAFSFNVAGLPASPATGSITAKVAPADDWWTRLYSSGNIAVWRCNDDTGGQRAYYRLDDITTIYTAMHCGEDWSGTTVLVNASTPRYIFKSSTADSTARPWIISVDKRAIMVYTSFHATHQGSYTMHGFGDIVAENPLDAYCGMLLGHNATATPLPSAHMGNYHTHLYDTIALGKSASRVGGTLSRSIDGRYRSEALCLSCALCVSPTAGGVIGAPGTTADPFSLSTPSIVTNGLYFNPVLVIGVRNLPSASPFFVDIRGKLPGVITSPQWKPYAEGTINEPVEGAYVGRSLYAIPLGSTAASAASKGMLMIDLTGPWR